MPPIQEKSDIVVSLTYYACISKLNDGSFSVIFPDATCVYTCADTIEDIIKKAKIELEDLFLICAECRQTFFMPSTLDAIENYYSTEYWELSNDRWESEEDRDYFKSLVVSQEFVPITVVPPNDAYLNWMIPYPKYN